MPTSIVADESMSASIVVDEGMPTSFVADEGMPTKIMSRRVPAASSQFSHASRSRNSSCLVAKRIFVNDMESS